MSETVCKAKFPIDIYRGSDRRFKVLARDHHGKPFSVATASEIKLLFSHVDPVLSPFEATLTGGQITLDGTGENGVIVCTLDETETVLLREGDAQSIELEIQIGSDTKIKELSSAINVKDRLFS